MDLGGSTATGPRDANEDNFYVIDFSDVRSFTNGITSFVMVSDGMGGYQGGDIASGLAVSSAESYIGQLLDMAAGNQVDLDAAVALSEISQNAHEAILAETRERGNASMGATFVGAFLSPAHAWIGHVGDSRAYLVRGGEAIQLTEDHSQVGRMLSRGLITEEEAQNHPARNRIERALGFSDANPEMNEVDLEPGDALLLCSDGVYTVLDSKAIASCVAGERSAESAAAHVVNKALSKGTDDNSTVAIALNVDPVQEQPRKRKPQPTIRATAVSQPRHAAPDRYRADEYTGAGRQKRPRSSQAGSRGRSASSRDPRYSIPSKRRFPWAIVIPIAVVIILAAALAAVFFLNPGGQENGEGSGVVSSSSSASESSSLATSESSTSSSTQSAGLGNYYVSQDAQDKALKYVTGDITGDKPYNFTESGPLQVEQSISLLDGRLVKAASLVSYEVDGENRTYRQLSNDYRTDLIDDCNQAAQSGFSAEFDSGLSQLFDQDAYRSFVERLARYSSTQLSDIQYLIVNESALSTSQAS